MNDQFLYDQVAEEMARDDFHPGLWTRAFSEAEGEKEKARALYIKLRVQALALESQQKEIESREAEEAARKRDRIYSNPKLLFDEAYRLHYKESEFDGAEALYRDLIQKFPDEKESRWAQDQLDAIAKLSPETRADRRRMVRKHRPISEAPHLQPSDSGNAASTPPEKHDSAATLYKEALHLHCDNADFTQAERLYTELIERFPDAEEALRAKTQLDSIRSMTFADRALARNKKEPNNSPGRSHPLSEARQDRKALNEYTTQSEKGRSSQLQHLNGKSKKVHPWRRLYARSFDYLCNAAAVVLGTLIIVLMLFPEDLASRILRFFASPLFLASPLYGGMILYVPMMLIESLFITTTGTTPGKWIFGISVLDKNGNRLRFADSFRRSFLVFGHGLGAAISFIAPFTQFFAYRRLSKTGTTLWDESTKAVVHHKSWGVIRATSCVLMTILSNILFFLMLAFLSLLLREMPQSKAQPSEVSSQSVQAPNRRLIVKPTWDEMIEAVRLAQTAYSIRPDLNNEAAILDSFSQAGVSLNRNHDFANVIPLWALDDRSNPRIQIFETTTDLKPYVSWEALPYDSSTSIVYCWYSRLYNEELLAWAFEVRLDADQVGLISGNPELEAQYRDFLPSLTADGIILRPTYSD